MSSKHEQHFRFRLPIYRCCPTFSAPWITIYNSKYLNETFEQRAGSMLCYHNFGTSVIVSLVPLVEQELHPFRSTWVQPRFKWSSCHSIFSFMCMLCGSLFFLFYFFFWTLCCLLFDLWILITPLVSWNSSWTNLIQVIEIEFNSLKKNESRYIDIKTIGSSRVNPQLYFYPTECDTCLHRTFFHRKWQCTQWNSANKINSITKWRCPLSV